MTAAADTDLAAREAKVKEDIAKIRQGLDIIVTREARTLGWSEGDAKLMAKTATVEYFRALTRHEAPQAALRHAIEEADRQYVAQYLQFVTRDGKTSMRHALQAVLLRRLDPNVPQERAALDVALHKFEETIMREHSVQRAVDACRNAAQRVLC